MHHFESSIALMDKLHDFGRYQLKYIFFDGIALGLGLG
jgi:hypothetical protein